MAALPRGSRGRARPGIVHGHRAGTRQRCSGRSCSVCNDLDGNARGARDEPARLTPEPISAATRRTPELAGRARAAQLEGEVLFDAFSRGRYSTDASIYQIEPIGVVVPKSDADVEAALAIAAEEGVPVLPRGGGTSQCGQTVGAGLVIDYSKHLNRVLELDAESRTAAVEPGLVLDQLNARAAAPRPVVPGRRLDRHPRHPRRHGRQQHLRRAARSATATWCTTCAPSTPCMADGSGAEFGEVPGNLAGVPGGPRSRALIRATARPGRARGRRDRGALPQGAAPGRRLQSRPGAAAAGHNMAHLLVGSEGTLAFFTPPQAEAAAAPAAQGRSASATSRPSTRPWSDPAHRRAGPVGGGAGRPHA